MIAREEAVAFVASDGSGAFPGRLELADTVVALYDEIDRLRKRADEAMEYAAGLEHYGATEDDTRGQVHVALRAERDTARAEVATLANLLRLAEASVSLLRGDVDHARLELRRLRAAEAPGTDDEALEGTGWISRPERPGHGWWTHANPSKAGLNVIVGRARNGRSGWIICGVPGNGWGAKAYPVALDAMRDAVPGSV